MEILFTIPEFRMFIFKQESRNRKGIFEGHIQLSALEEERLRERERERAERISLKKKIMKRLKI